MDIDSQWDNERNLAWIPLSTTSFVMGKFLDNDAFNRIQRWIDNNDKKKVISITFCGDNTGWLIYYVKEKFE